MTGAPIGRRARARHGAVRGAVAGVAVLLVAGCPPRVPRVDLSNLTDAVASARVHQAAARRVRMAGTVKAKLPGLQGAVMSADLDVALQPPAMLSVAVRSFFEQPQQILVTDGDVVTLYDATSGKPVFRRGPVTEEAIKKILPLPLWPKEVVEVFLAHPPDRTPGKLMSVDEKKGTYEVWFEPEGDAPFEITVRAADDAIVHWTHYRKDGLPSLEVAYGDLRPVGTSVMPFSWRVTVVDTKQALDFIASDVTFNGPPLPAEAFHLEPPPGTILLPL